MFLLRLTKYGLVMLQGLVLSHVINEMATCEWCLQVPYFDMDSLKMYVCLWKENVEQYGQNSFMFDVCRFFTCENYRREGLARALFLHNLWDTCLRPREI